MGAMRRDAKNLQWHQSSLNRLTGLNLAIANSFILFFDVLMVCVAGRMYLSGRVDFDGFLLPVLALMSSFGPVSALAGLGTTLQNTVASGARVLAILEEEPETEEITGMPGVEFHGAECRMVGFGYGAGPVLRNFSLSIPENQIIGIVGESGCGKSTLLKLLMRFWAVQKGKIGIVTEKDNAKEMAGKCLENGLLILTAKNLLRMLPPLTITYEEIDKGLAILKNTMEA